MSSVIAEINNDFTTKITDIQKNNEHDEYDINSNRASWNDILAIYTVKVSGGKDDVELMTLSDERIQILKSIFWDMNTISSSTEKVTKDITTTDENGNTKTEKKEQTILHITVTSKSVEDMIYLYNLNNAQQIQLAELRKKEYASMWNSVIYGTSSGSQDIVQVAKQQIGNIRTDSHIGVGMALVQELNGVRVLFLGVPNNAVIYKQVLFPNSLV